VKFAPGKIPSRKKKENTAAKYNDLSCLAVIKKERRNHSGK